MGPVWDQNPEVETPICEAPCIAEHSTLLQETVWCNSTETGCHSCMTVLTAAIPSNMTQFVPVHLRTRLHLQAVGLPATEGGGCIVRACGNKMIHTELGCSEDTVLQLQGMRITGVRNTCGNTDRDSSRVSVELKLPLL
jgi:hypothetical protein